MMKINGVWVDTVKDPITDPGKKSKGGIQDTDEFVTYYKNGEVLYRPTWDEIRKRAMESRNRWLDGVSQ